MGTATISGQKEAHGNKGDFPRQTNHKESQVKTFTLTTLFSQNQFIEKNTWSGSISRILSHAHKEPGGDHVSGTHVTMGF